MGSQISHLIVYTDGASRGNPGPGAAAYVLLDGHDKEVSARAVFLGECTNNVAEYTGLVKALEEANDLGAKTLEIFSDSELMVKQITGQYKVKSDLIRPLFEQIKELLAQFDNWRIGHVRRNNNKRADELCNICLDRGEDINTEPKNLTKGQRHLRLGVLVSGGGRTLVNILECIERGELDAEVPVVICSRSQIKGVERAKKAGLKVVIIRKKDHPDIDSFSKAIEDELIQEKIDLVIQAGWLCLWKIPERLTNKVMNIHPALLPSFGGKGMWGHHVHEAVLAASCKVSGCTVHFCTNEYDDGPIIVQRCCTVEEGDTADDLADRVFGQECIAYPQAIKLFSLGRLKVENKIVKILPGA